LNKLAARAQQRAIALSVRLLRLDPGRANGLGPFLGVVGDEL
jgi:hypothetical protein